eukprot:gnl/TRDRNA2_/TRDRNA2_167015_c0_seq4.p1 gnl/TRDRNA2_/TRDRNA2_167015_c0~~gnl/TRDRNA2_/TRDRNA2_167015_c0_seq4.p1  ORF type:complete len:352 (+),score=63.32 gnl/TRDRNA2_/TRDRNA2_167015_c0_seq4:95-1150(+)
MRSICLNLLLAGAVVVNANNRDVADQLADRLVDKLVDKLMDRALTESQMHQEEMDGTTLGKYGPIAMPMSNNDMDDTTLGMAATVNMPQRAWHRASQQKVPPGVEQCLNRVRNAPASTPSSMSNRRSVSAAALGKDEPVVVIGVAADSGCGKSTFMLTLLRIVEARSGRIVFNGEDICEMGLQVVRNSIGLVPQDPVLFSGSLRKNLDPFDMYTDEGIWIALWLVSMVDFVQTLPQQIYTPLADDGRNFSFGQRQLLCIARMILSQPALLLLDEATSAIDPSTQEKLHRAIHTSFPRSTIVAIAHRLETILDFDTCVVMDKGRVIERGGVQALRSNPNSVLAKMLVARGLQ